MLLMTGISFLCSLAIIPLILLFCRKFSIYDKPNPRKVHTGNIPRLGGAGFVPVSIICIIIYYRVFCTPQTGDVFPLLLGGLIIFTFGIVDDFLNLPAKLKLLIQCISAFIVVSNNFVFTRFGNLFLPEWLQYVITFLWIIGMTNSYNLIDGIDCLCGGLSFLNLGTLGFISLSYHSDLTTAVCFITCGALLGFLFFNKPKAKIFMGDGGSQFLGFLISALPLSAANNIGYDYNKFTLMILFSSIPLLDTIAAIWRRTREHRSFFSPDKAHLHHKLMNIGFTTGQVLLILLPLQILLCIIGYLAVSLPEQQGAVLLLLGLFIIMFFFCIIHFANRAVNRQRLHPEKDTDTADETPLH